MTLVEHKYESPPLFEVVGNNLGATELELPPPPPGNLEAPAFHCWRFLYLFSPIPLLEEFYRCEEQAGGLNKLAGTILGTITFSDEGTVWMVTGVLPKGSPSI